MGKNKRLRQQADGYAKQIEIHKAKIRAELEKPHPDRRAIEKWVNDIERNERLRTRRELKLPQRRTT
jgi:predicted regulator of amino acid metabolism with ACT domain